MTIWDETQQRRLTFLTNLMHLAASTIAAIYKERWQIELLFKALKQHLKIKTFVGTSENAVQVQIWIALIAMVLLKYLRLKSTWPWSLSNLAALLRFNLLTYRDLWTWLNAPFKHPRSLRCPCKQGFLPHNLGQHPDQTTSFENRRRSRLKRSIHAGDTQRGRLFWTAVASSPLCLPQVSRQMPQACRRGESAGCAP